MKFTDLSFEERKEVIEKIIMIIGKKEDAITDKMSTSERIQARMKYDKTFNKLADIYAKYGSKALSMAFTDKGWIKEGATPNGKKWFLEMNCGMTTRSRYCGTLYIDGEMIFTSGTLEKSFEYILNN